MNNSNTNTSNKNITTKSITPKNLTVPPLIIKKNRLLSDHKDSNSRIGSFSRKTFLCKKTISRSKNIFFSTTNRYSPLELMETTQNEKPTNANNVQSDALNANTGSQIKQSQIAENNPKIPPLFVINMSQFAQLRREITEAIQNNFTIASKFNKIKINVQLFSLAH